ncbi:MAG: GldM family protein [Bacteroidota bacterium]
MGGNSPGALSPRQRMINMMYLVLTAMLALNVSKEILNAFIVVNEGLEKTNENFSKKTELLYNQMNNQWQLDSAKVDKFYRKSLEIEKESQELVDYINKLKNILIARTEKADTTGSDWETTTWEDEDGQEHEALWREVPVSKLKSRDNYDTPTLLMVPDGDIQPEKGYGYKLKMRIENYKKSILDILDDEEISGDISLGLSTENQYSHIENKELTWQTYNFYHSILAADLVMFNKIIAEVRNAEADAVNRLLSSISISDFKFDEVEAKVVPSSNYIISGEDYSADIFVAAISSTQQPDVYVLEGADTSATRNEILENGTRIDSSHNGMTKYIVKPGGLGDKSYAGVVKMRIPGTTGEKPEDFNYYPFNSSYIVAEPTAVISATAVNVLYRGVANPVEVSAPGVAAARLSVTASNASVSGGNGSYNLKPGNGGTSVVRVSARQDDGGSKFMGEMEFRVRRLPDPEIVVSGKKSGDKIAKNILTRSRLYPKLDALFNVQYQVVRFSMDVTVGQNTQTFNASGDRLSDQMQNIVSRLNRGSTVAFKNITVRGPDGTRPIPGVFFTIQ